MKNAWHKLKMSRQYPQGPPPKNKGVGRLRRPTVMFETEQSRGRHLQTEQSCVRAEVFAEPETIMSSCIPTGLFCLKARRWTVFSLNVQTSRTLHSCRKITLWSRVGACQPLCGTRGTVKWLQSRTVDTFSLIKLSTQSTATNTTVRILRSF